MQIVKKVVDFFKKIWKNIKINLIEVLQTLQNDGKQFIIFAVSLFILMGAFCLAVFFITVKGPEQVLVPNVVGKDLAEALIELQQKELYPRVQLRYSNSPEEKNTILDQSPDAGSIVKAPRHLNITVSRGVVLDSVEDYIGQSFEDVKLNLQLLFASSPSPLIVLQDPPMYKFSGEPAGTVLEQEPPAGTDLSTPITLKLVVSRGTEITRVEVPNITGMNINDLITQITRVRVVFEFTSRIAQEGEEAGVVVSQSVPPGNVIDAYGSVSAEVILPAEQKGNVRLGIFSYTLPNYLYAVPIEVTADTPDGESFPVINMNHPGGLLSIPYELPVNTVLTLSVSGTQLYTTRVQ